jgi:hypothetical protein
VLVQEEARFAQTGVGWVLRSLSDVYPDQVFEFLQQHQEHVSVECMRMATARLSDKKRKALGVTGKRETKVATILWTVNDSSVGGIGKRQEKWLAATCLARMTPSDGHL